MSHQTPVPTQNLKTLRQWVCKFSFLYTVLCCWGSFLLDVGQTHTWNPTNHLFKCEFLPHCGSSAKARVVIHLDHCFYHNWTPTHVSIHIHRTVCWFFLYWENAGVILFCTNESWTFYIRKLRHHFQPKTLRQWICEFSFFYTTLHDSFLLKVK